MCTKTKLSYYLEIQRRRPQLYIERGRFIIVIIVLGNLKKRKHTRILFK